MTVDVGPIIAAIVPTVVIAVVGWLLSKRWDAVDKSIEEVKSEQHEHNRVSVAVHENQWKAITATAAKVARIEGKMEG